MEPERHNYEIDYLRDVISIKKRQGVALLNEFAGLVENSRNEYLENSNDLLYVKQIMANRMESISYKNWEKSVIENYKEKHLPRRKKMGIDTIWAHGTDIKSLFGQCSRRLLPQSKDGIIFDGFLTGDFGQFESSEAGGQGGWWRNTSAIMVGRNSSAWILRGDETDKILITIPNLRAYIDVLDELERKINDGLAVSPQIIDVVSLSELDSLLVDNNGLLEK